MEVPADMLAVIAQAKKFGLGALGDEQKLALVEVELQVQVAGRAAL